MIPCMVIKIQPHLGSHPGSPPGFVVLFGFFSLQPLYDQLFHPPLFGLRRGRPFIFHTFGYRWWSLQFDLNRSFSAWRGFNDPRPRCSNLTSRFLGFLAEGKSVWRSSPIWISSGFRRHSAKFLYYRILLFLFFSCLQSWLPFHFLRSPRRASRHILIPRISPPAPIVANICTHHCLIPRSSFQHGTRTPPTPNRRPLSAGNVPHCPHSLLILDQNSSHRTSRRHPCRILARADTVGDRASLLEPTTW